LIAFLRNDAVAMQKEATDRKTRLESQGAFEQQEALTLAYHGRVKEANQLSGSAIALARQGGFRERPVEFEGARAVWNALFGMQDDARRSATTSLSQFRGRDADYGPAFALALLSNSVQADKTVAELARKYPEDTSVQFSYLPAIRALEALNHGDPAKAVELSKGAAPYEFAIPGTAYLPGAPSFGTLYPVYVRGLAYSRMNRYSEAAAEFQKILDHPGMTLNDPIGPLARLQFARALSAAGDHVKAAAVYRDLLNIWKDADADLPVVQRARAEAAREHA
jgi:tetratricopeptide (TPR) repeat protein